MSCLQGGMPGVNVLAEDMAVSSMVRIDGEMTQGDQFTTLFKATEVMLQKA